MCLDAERSDVMIKDILLLGSEELYEASEAVQEDELCGLKQV